ncbi:hypothetical protein [Treponema zioleckii]|uniref:hypothetical protein n=1 Tax=Treponema zioleckii TaxID=331680 RepID=UPI00168BEC28|nr:hypothetical protein [Treponema zioleckii]
MKKQFFFAILLTLSQIAFGNPNYKNGNGTVISSTEKNGLKTTIRKCVIKNVKIGDLLEEKNRNIYEDYIGNKVIGKLKDNDEINVLEVLTVEYLTKPKNKWGEAAGQLWYKIQLNNSKGCICVSQKSLGEYVNPYYENRYEVLEEIQGAKKWAVRRLKQSVSIWERLNVRDKPGLEGKKVFLLHNFETRSRSLQENYEIHAITEETETIDGLTDH